MTVRLALIKSHIEIIGNELVGCDLNCDGVKNHIKYPGSNTPPRCLYLDRTGINDDKPGVIVVGINPGTMKKAEQRVIDRRSDNGSISYKDVIEAWQDHGKKRNYYNRCRKVIKDVNQLTSNVWDGPILWTELVKCQNDDKIKAANKISKETYRNCTHRFLMRELLMMPRSYLLMAIGSDSYRALCYLCPDRPLLGVPHLTGSRNPKILDDISAALVNQKHWLTKFVSYIQQDAEADGRRRAAPACWLKTPGTKKKSST